MNAPGHNPAVARIQLSTASQVIVDGLTISPETAPSFFYTRLFHVESHGYHSPSHNICIQNCILYGIQNSDSWDLQEWNDVGSCIKMDGNHMTAINNSCKNIEEGIGIFGDTALALNHVILTNCNIF